MSAYPGLMRRKSGVYAIRMRIPQDIVSLIESDPSIWKALALNPGARPNKWRDALTSMKRGQPVTVKKEFNQSLSARKLADAKAPYFALRNELEAVFETIRAAYGHEPLVATGHPRIPLITMRRALPSRPLPTRLLRLATKDWTSATSIPDRARRYTQAKVV